jgi:hypothetical protein
MVCRFVCQSENRGENVMELSAESGNELLTLKGNPIARLVPIERLVAEDE